jgi:CubicO group peptidase (beta-lactamase class C family)
MRKYRNLFVCCFLLVLVAGAEAMESVDPAGEGFIPGRLSRVDVAIQDSIDSDEIAGAVGLVVRNGKIVYQKAFGHADIDSGAPTQPDSIFRIASMTKAVTTVAVMMLYEEGHFQLNDPVSRFIPEFANPQVIILDDEGQIIGTRPASREIRIIDLLSHTSGLAYGSFPSPLQDKYFEAGIIDGLTASDATLGPNISKLAGLPLLFDPGSSFAYSLSTDVLGYVVEVVSGQPLDRFFEDRIFEPLKMTDTYFYLPESKSDRLVTLYAHVDGQGLVVSSGNEADIKLDNPKYPIEGAKSYFSGGAGLSSTARDYARFLQMLLNNGQLDGAQILGRKSVELMRTARVDWDGDNLADFGLGFQVTGELGKSGELGSQGAYSWGGAYNTSYWIDPEENLVGVFMSQARPVKSDIRDLFKIMVYQALE